MKRVKPPSSDNHHPPALIVKPSRIKKKTRKRMSSQRLQTRANPRKGGILRKHADAFAWTPTDMTGIPRFIAEHELKTYPHIEPRVKRKRSIAPDRMKVAKEEVAE
ncbi:hypothetical protein Tco_0622232 [Tanacetum coccineum]